MCNIETVISSRDFNAFHVRVDEGTCSITAYRLFTGHRSPLETAVAAEFESILPSSGSLSDQMNEALQVAETSLRSAEGGYIHAYAARCSRTATEVVVEQLGGEFACFAHGSFLAAPLEYERFCQLSTTDDRFWGILVGSPAAVDFRLPREYGSYRRTGVAAAPSEPTFLCSSVLLQAHVRSPLFV